MAIAMDAATKQVKVSFCFIYFACSGLLNVLAQPTRTSSINFSSQGYTPSIGDAMDVAQLALVKRAPVFSQQPRRATQPNPPHQTPQSTRPPPQSSLPELRPINKVALRAQKGQDAAALRMQKSAQLNHYMSLFRKQCPRCFVTTGALRNHEFADCLADDGETTIPSNWMPLKLSLHFPVPFSYCYTCGLPQD